MAVRDCSFEYFSCMRINVNEPATSLEIGHHTCDLVKTLEAVSCKIPTILTLTSCFSLVLWQINFRSRLVLIVPSNFRRFI
jgi:hypothetical protein